MTTIEKVKETLNNMLHANENAEAVKKESKRARRNATIGGLGIGTSIISSVIIHYRWSKKINELQDEQIKRLKSEISRLEDKVVELERMSREGE